MNWIVVVVVALVAAAYLYVKKSKKNDAPLPTAAPLQPPVTGGPVNDPPFRTPPPPMPPVAVDPIVPPAPPAPPPPTPPAQPAAPSIDYARYAGLTKFEVLVTKFGGRLPEGWDWEAAYKAGVIRPDVPATPAISDPAQPAEDRWDGRLRLALMERYWRGAAGAVSSFPMPVPAGWRGTVEFMVGESSVAGDKVDQFDVVVTNAAGQVLQSASKTSYASLGVGLNGDEGSLTVTITQYQEGGGFIKVNPVRG